MIVVIAPARPAPEYRAVQNPDGPDWLLLENGQIIGHGLTEAHAKFFSQAGNEKHSRAVSARIALARGEMARWN